MERARSIAAGLAARAAAHDAAGAFPADDVADLRRAGLLGLMAPARLGGLGASFATYAQVARILAEASPATALIFNMHASVTGALAAADDDLARALGAPDSFLAARDRVLAEAAKGALLQVASSEPGGGARLSQTRCRYWPEGDGWRIVGRKTFCTGAGQADAYLVTAASAQGQVSHFLVPGGAGVAVLDTWDAHGMRATASHDLVLDVTAPGDALLGGVEGLAPLLAAAMPQWLVASYAAVYVGVAAAAVAAGAAEARRRGLSRLPAVRARIGRADAAVEAAWLVTLEAARRVDDAPGEAETNRWVHRAKLLAGDTAAETASSMVEACGASALRRGCVLERLLRDARCGAVQPATSDVCADWLGAAALGLDPDADADEPRW